MQKKQTIIEQKATKLSKKLGENASEEDVNKVRKNLNKMNRGIVSKVWDKVLNLWQAFNSPDTPVVSKIIIIGSLLYLVLPFDVISDVIPGLGFVDDVFVIGLTVQQVLNITAKTVYEVAKEPVDNFIKEKIQNTLNISIKKSVINIAISLVVMVIALLVIIYKDWNIVASFYISSFLLIGLIIWNITKLVINVHKSWSYFVAVIKNRSIKKGIANYIKTEYKITNIYENVVSVGSQVVPSLKMYPQIEDIVNHYIKFACRKLLLFFILIAIYTVAFSFIIKPFLFTFFSGIQMKEIYLYPFMKH